MRIKNMGVTVLGTASEAFDYDSESKLETTLLDDKVRVGLRDPSVKNGREVILNPNEMLVLDRQVSITRIKTVSAEEYSGWCNGVLSLESERLNVILARLEL